VDGDWETATSDTVWKAVAVPVNQGYYETGYGSAPFPQHGGSRESRIRVNTNAVTLTLSQTMTVCPGALYNFSGWTRRNTGTLGLTCQIAFAADGTTFATSNLPTYSIPGVPTWFQTTATGVQFAGTTGTLAMTLSCPGSSGTGVDLGVFLDDLVLTAAT